MPCCLKCFNDPEAQGFIESQSSIIGTCNYCNSEDVPLIDPGDMEELLYYIFNSYQNYPNANLSLGVDDPVMIHDHIPLFWPNLFNTALLDSAKREQLIFDIAGELSIKNPLLLTEPVEMKCFLDSGIADEAFLQENNWIKFADEIKHTNRYFVTNVLNLDTLLVLINNHKKFYPPGKRFYRSRLCESLIPPVDMGKPPANLSKAGRANPSGIPYLYLAHDKLTTAYETRASLHDKLSIATFDVIEEIQVISLRDIQSISPLVFTDDLDKFAVHRKYMLRLSQELSRPVNKSDSEMDYLPTQYLCEFLKFSGFDAVEYQSSLNPKGINITLFNDSKVSCLQSELYQVNGIEYEFDPGL